MISIRKASDELERLEEIIHGARDSYRDAILSTAHYATEVDTAEVDEFRQHLRALEAAVASAQAPENWKALQSSFRGELRSYRDRTASQVANLRQQVRVASEAVQLFAENVAVIDSDHETQLKTSLQTLTKVAGAVNPETAGAAIRSTVNAISESLQVMRRRHHMAITELRQEIRVLHNHIEVERRAHLLDSATGVWNRQMLDTHIEGLLEKDKPFCLLLVCVRNLPRLDVRYSRSVVDGALKSLLHRFAEMLTEGATIGRWDERHFAAVLEIEPTAAMAVSRLVTKKLAGDYSVQENGISQTITLHAAAGVVDRPGGCEDAIFRTKLAQMIQVLTEG